METTLLSISKIFTERIFRIPDYQRGYAWTEKQLKDFWNDLIQLEENRNHYVGVLTLELVPEDVYNKWEDDLWIIKSKNYTPFYIVDGQQRLTTTIIFIQSILETISNDNKLNFTSKLKIKEKFIFESKDEGISRSYLFGYEKDNPSYEYLKTQIFKEKKDNDFKIEETTYTNNLEFAKAFFKKSLEKISLPEKEILYRKITQNFLFNIYTITCDIDVFVTFETMNNRGKPLSVLELLKNRLIYLSTRLNEDVFEKNRLRKRINDCWKSIYHSLGKSKDNPLNDDTFLRTHSFLYYGAEILINEEDKEEHNISRKNYRLYYRNPNSIEILLLEDKYTIKSLNDGKLTLGQINKYVNDIQESVEIWYNIFNPSGNIRKRDEKLYLERLNRMMDVMRWDRFNIRTLLLSVLQYSRNQEEKVLILSKIERLVFIFLWVQDIYYGGAEFKILNLAIKFKEKKINFEKFIKEIEEISHHLLNEKDLQAHTKKRFRQDGFYKWSGIRYLLFEYEQYLKNESKTKHEKIEWNILLEDDSTDYISVEHIYPQNPRHSEWLEKFKQFSTKEKKVLKNSLGNLLPLSKPKNSSLQNKPFNEKVGMPSSKVGYRYGSFSENEITEYKDWTAISILDRGINLLEFVEKRWSIKIGDRTKKIEYLGLEFLEK